MEQFDPRRGGVIHRARSRPWVALMEISIQRTDDKAVIDVSGRMVYGETVRDLHMGVKELVAQGVNWIVVNLGEVSYLDSSGVEALMASYSTCMKVQGGLRLINVHGKARTVLHITKLESLFGLSSN